MHVKELSAKKILNSLNECPNKVFIEKEFYFYCLLKLHFEPVISSEMNGKKIILIILFFKHV
jgi:hypothetical protein